MNSIYDILEALDRVERIGLNELDLFDKQKTYFKMGNGQWIVANYRNVGSLHGPAHDLQFFRSLQWLDPGVSASLGLDQKLANKGPVVDNLYDFTDANALRQGNVNIDLISAVQDWVVKNPAPKVASQQPATQTQQPAMAETYDDDEELCHMCSGTGEGRHESESCSHCRGTGVEPSDEDDDYDDFDIPDPDPIDYGDDESHYEKFVRSRGLEEGSKFSFANPKQKPGDQVRGTERATKKKSGEHPFKGRLVGTAESLEREFESYLQDIINEYGMTTGGTSNTGTNQPGGADDQKQAPGNQEVATIQKSLNRLKGAGVPIKNINQATQSTAKDPTTDPMTTVDRDVAQGLGQAVQDIIDQGGPAVDQLVGAVAKAKTQDKVAAAQQAQQSGDK